MTLITENEELYAEVSYLKALWGNISNLSFEMTATLKLSTVGTPLVESSKRF